MSRNNQTRNVSKELACGMFGGTFGILAAYPFDTIKTRMQTGARCLSSTIRDTFKRRGFTGFYRGLSIPMASQPLYSGGAFAGLELGRYLFDSCVPRSYRAEQPEESEISRLIISGGISGIFAATAVTPGERLKVVIQSQGCDGVQSFRNTIGSLWSNGGLRSLYRGWGACLAREVPGKIAWFGTYEATSSYLMSEWHVPRPAAVMSGGMLASLAFWSICMPVDRVMMLQMASQQGHHAGTMQQVIRHIARTEGLSGFFQGVKPVMARAMVMGGIQFMVIDQVRQLME